jgi:hypothetical protein
MTLVIDHSGRVFTQRQVTIKDVVVNRHVADLGKHQIYSNFDCCILVRGHHSWFENYWKFILKYWYVSGVSRCDSGFISCGQRKWWQISPVKEGATKGHSDVLCSAQVIPSWGGRWVTVRARLVIETCLGFETFGTMVSCNIWEQILRLPPKQKRLYRVQKIRTRLHVCVGRYIYIYISIYIYIYISYMYIYIYTYVYI